MKIMTMEKRIKAILKNMQNKRRGQYLFDDDSVTEYIVKYFKKKGYKVRIINSWGTICIEKRWWQK
jgi:hypothetical protein